MEIQEIKQKEIEEIQEEEKELDNISNKKNKNWFQWVGPTVRIAGVGAVAAPIMIPPVIVLTTVGGALCIPFGVYLSTVALTDKFMSYIFPIQRGEGAKLGFDIEEGKDLSFEFQDGDYQRVYTEKEAQQQIETIRAIIGYKPPKQPSFVEELHAILNFIGIEPPLSLKEHAYLNEISSTIHLVKSLIGVK